MTQNLSPPLIEFRPVDASRLRITDVSGLTANQVQLITAPFLPNENPKVIATLENFSISCDLSEINLPSQYKLKVYVFVKGSASRFAKISYNPTPPKLLKSALWRLAPDVTGSSADNTNVVSVSLPQAYPVARLHALVRGRFDPNAPPV